MKIKSGFILREICGQNVIVAIGKRADEFNGIVTINETGKIIWNELRQGTDRNAIVKKMMSIFEAEQIKIEQDVDAFILKLKEANIIDE